MNWFPAISPVRAFQAFQLMRQAAALLTSVVLAKSTLPAEQIGVYEQLFFVQYAISFFWVSGLIQALLSLYPGLETQQQGPLIGTAYTFLAALSILLSLFLYFGSGPVLSFLVGKTYLPFFPVFVLQLLLHLPTFLLEYLLLLQERGREIIWFGVFSFGGALLAIGVPVFAGFGLEGAFRCLVALGIAKHLWLLYEVGQVYQPYRASKSLLVPWLSLAVPLVAYAFLGGLIQAYGGWAVNHYFDGEEVPFAQFRFGAREFPLLLALSEALNAALIPLVASQGTGSFAEIRQKTLRLLHRVFPITILLLASSGWWFPLLFSKAFEGSIPVLNAFFFLAVTRLVFPRAILIGLRDNQALLLFSLLEFLVLAAGAALLLPRWGIQGVALATVLAFWVEKGLQVFRLKYRFGIPPSAYIPLRWWAGYSALLLLAYLFPL